MSNAREIIKSYPTACDLYINIRNRPNRTLDFYFFGFHLGTYRYHVGRDLSDYTGTETGEDIFRRKIDDGNFPEVSITHRFSVTPRLKGVRGFDGGVYGGLSDSLKFYFRRTINTLFPSVWI